MKNRLRVSAVGALVVTLLGWTLLPEAPVADAAMRGDAAAVRALLEGGADVNTAQGDGMTALHWAAQNGDVDIAGLLIYAGANLEARTRLGEFTPLLVAARVGNAGVVKRLLEAGADTKAHTATGETALHFAAAAGSVDAVNALLAHGAEVDAREAAHGQTPLMFAAAYDRADVIKALLAHGADVSLETTVVDIPAVAKADNEIARERMARLRFLSGATEPAAPRRGPPAPAAKAPAKEGAKAPAGKRTEAAKDAAVKPGDKKAPAKPGEKKEEPQVGSGANPPQYTDLVGEQGGLTALHYAAREGNEAAAMALLEGGADINEVTGGDHTTPLLMATVNGNFDLAMALLERGADPNVASVPGATPLFAAINLQWAPKSWYPQPVVQKQQKTTYLVLMKALLDKGADPNVRLKEDLWFVTYNGAGAGANLDGATPFWRAAWGTDVDAMKLLVQYGADPNIPTRKPAQRGYSANPDGDKVKDDPSGLPPVPVGGPGVYPIQAASGEGYGEGFAANTHRHAPDGWLPAVKYLVEELGADVNSRDFSGYTALHNAASRGDTDLIQYLVAHGADVTVVSRKGQTTVDMANGPVQRVQPFPDAVQLLESLGAKNNHNCVSC